MGYYIETPRNKFKAAQICVAVPGAALFHMSDTFKFSDIPEGKALICVVDNGPFEAAAFCYSEEEFKVFNSPTDTRPKDWILMDRTIAEELTNFNLG